VRRGAFLAASAAFAAAPSIARSAVGSAADDELFMRIANAATERFARSPAYVSYRVSGTVHAFHGESPFERRLTCSAGDTVPEFLAPPTFDALSHWTFDMNFNEAGSKDGPQRTVEASFSNVAPLRYRTDIDPHADAIVNAVKGYRLSRLPDENATTGHIGLQRIDRKRHDASLRDLYYDFASMLPVRVVYEGKDDFVLDVGYAPVGDYWLVSRLRFGYTAFVLGHLVHSSFACTAVYDEFTFLSP
jgi:hypothetical protein